MIIDVENGLIEVKTNHELFVKEASGVKPYTVRVFDDVEYGMIQTMEVAINDATQAVTLANTDNETGESVRRQVTDITTLAVLPGRYMVGIAFKHVAMGADYEATS